MATRDSTDTGVGITRTSLVTSLAERYQAWDNKNERLAPKEVDFLNNNYVGGFKMNKVAGDASDIRSIGLGGPGAKSLYSEENGIPNSVNFLSDKFQDQFKKNQQVRITSYKNTALNYINGVPGFDNRRYYTGGISS